MGRPAELLLLLLPPLTIWAVKLLARGDVIHHTPDGQQHGELRVAAIVLRQVFK